MFFSASRELQQLVFGSDCEPLSCSVTEGSDSFSMAYAGDNIGYFFYGLEGQSGVYQADVIFAGPVRVPVPGAAILLFSALLGLGRFTSRSRN